MPLNGDKWWAEKPAVVPVKPNIPQVPTHFQPTYQPPGSAQAGFTPFWKTEKFKNFIAGLKSSEPMRVSALTSNIKPLAVTTVARPTARTTPQRPRIPVTAGTVDARFPVGGALNPTGSKPVYVPAGLSPEMREKVVAEMKSRPRQTVLGYQPTPLSETTPGLLVLDPDGNAVRTNEDIIVLSSMGFKDLTPFTTRAGQPQERANLINLAISQGWTDKEIERGLLVYDYFEHSENLGFFNLGTKGKNWVAAAQVNPSIATSFGLNLVNVIELGIETGRLAFNVWKPWRTDPDTGKLEIRIPPIMRWRSPARAEQAIAALEDKLQRWDWIQSPQEKDRLLEQISDIRQDVADMNSEARRVSEAWTAIAGSMDSTAVAVGEANRKFADDVEIVSGRAVVSPSSIYKYFMEPAFDLSEERKGELIQYSNVTSGEVQKIFQTIQSGKVIITPNTMAEIRDLQKRYLQEGISLDLVAADRELTKIKTEDAPFLTTEQVKELQDKALQLQMKANDAYIRAMTNGNFQASQYYSLSYQREPLRLAHFRRNLAEFVIQTGRQPDFSELMRLKQQSENAGTEILGEVLFDVTNLIDVDILLDAVPVLKLATKAATDAVLWKPLRIIAENTPVLKFFIKESNVSVATRFADMVSDTFGKVLSPYRGNLPEFASEILPRIGRVFDEIRHASSDIIRATYDDITNPASKAYIRGMENMSYQEFYRLRNMADEVTGVAGEGWKELYEKAYDRALRTHETKLEDVLRGRDYSRKSAEWKAAEIKKSMELAIDEGQVDLLTNKLFSENFKDAFLKSHRVVVGKEASKLLDDTVFGQMIQKLRFLGDQAADMPRAEELKKIVGAQDLLNAEIASMDYLLKDKSWITRLYKKVVKAVAGRKMSFGDVLDNWLITKGREMGRGGFKVAADWMENTHWILTKMYEGWVMAVLSLNPRWFIQNFIDSSFRTIAYGGNPLEDIHMLMTATHKHLADQLGVVPGAIGQNLARGGIDETYSVASRILYESWKPTYGPISWIKFEYDRLAREGVRNLEDAPEGIRKMFEARIPKSGLGKHLQALGTGFRNTLLAIPGAASDFNTAIEFTIRLRMFSREYFKLYDALNPIAKNIGTDRLTSTVRTLFERIWDASGGNAAMMNSIVNNIVESTLGAEEGAVLSNADRLSKSWSLLFNAETVDELSALSSVEKHAFLADMTDRFNEFRGEILKSGRDLNEKDVSKFLDDIQSGVNSEFSARIKKYNETLGMNIDLKDNPDAVPPKPTWDDASKFESSTFSPPTRATRNSSLKQMWKNAKEYFIPSVGKEVHDAVVAMRSIDFLPAEKSVESFRKAMSGFAEVSVSELGGRKMHAWVDAGGVTHLELPKDILSTDKAKVKAQLTEGIAHALSARDSELIKSAYIDMPLEDALEKYRADFVRFINSPATVATDNTMSFFVVSSQLHADPAMREMLERMYNHKLDFEAVAQLKRNAGLSYMEIMRGEWATEDDLLKLGDPMPIDVRLAGKVKALSTVSLFDALEKKATGDLRLELATYLENSRIASALFDNFLQMGYPGYRKLRGKLRRIAATDRYALMKNSYELLTTHNRTLEQMIQSVPDKALEYLTKFNDDFATNYLEHSGITNIVRTVDGGVASFDIAAQGKKKTIRHTTALQGDYGIETYFFGEFNNLKRNTTVTIDPSKFLEEGKSAVEQVQSALIYSFGLTDTNAKDVATIQMKRAEDIASRLNQPLDAVLRDRYGFAKTGRQLSASNGVLLSARNPLNKAEERFTFYGSGSNNVLGVMTQLSQMHYQDLMYMAKFGDLRAGADLRAINARISAVTKTDVALTGKLTDRQAEVLADAYLEWVKNGVTEVHGLKGPLTRLSQQVAHVVEHMGKDFKRLDTDSLALLERAFFTTGDKIPSANSYMIRSMAKKQGLSTRATDLLRMINAHPDVLGMSDVHKTKFVDGLIALGRPADEAEFTYDLFRLVSFSKNPEFPGAWLAKHELIKGEELDLEAFARASKSIPILFSDVDPSVVQNMVDFVFRKVNRGENVNLVSTFSNMIIEAGSDLERTYILKFINETDPSLQSDIVAALKKHYRSQGLVDAILEQANDLPAYDKRVGGVVYSTDSDAFKSWFKTSVATDADGMPKVMYAAPAAIGEDKQFGENLANSLWTSSAKNDLPVYVSVQNPFILDKTYTLSEVSDLFFTRAGSIDEKIVAKLKAKNLEVITGEDVWKAIRMTDANADEFFTKYGFDGLSKGEQIIPFKKSQIKSVFNMGTWSPTTDDMLFQRQNILKTDPRLLHQDTKGAFWISNGQRRIAVWESANVSTVAHEVGHSILRELAQIDDWRIRTVETWVGIPEGKFMEYQEAFNLRKHAERGLLKPNLSPETRVELETIVSRADTYRVAHEKFANGTVEYLYTQAAPTPELKSVFEWFKQKLSIIWNGVKDMMPGISEDMVKVYDSVLTSGIKIPKQRYSSLGDVPLEIAEKVFGEGEATRLSNEMNAAFAAYKQQEMFRGFSKADLSTFQGFKDVINSRIEDAASPELENVYRAIMYNLEHFQTEIGKHHLTDELLEFLQPKIRDYNIGPSTKTVLAHNLQNIQVKEGIDNALSAMRADWTARVRGGGAVLPVLSRAEADELLQHTTKAARMKSSLIDTIVNGGQMVDDAGKVLAESEGALAKTNHVLLDYSKRTNLDNFMKIFFPFWMFPSRSIPFWTEALVMHPWIGGLYYKLQRMSETQRIQAGAVDSRGNPIKSLKGYIRMGTSDVWINPLAPMSFRYLLDMAQFLHKDLYAKPQADEGDLVGLPYVVKEFLQTAPIIGFNVAPWWSYAFKRGLNIPDDVMPNWSIAPQFGLLPKFWTRQFTDGISDKSGPLHSFLTRWVFPEPSWQDSLIETRIREEAYQRAQDMTKEEFDAYKIQIEIALKEKGDNPIWLQAFKDWSMDESERNQLAFWTGVYPKTFNDAQADLIGLKTRNTLMTEAQNNNWVAAAMGLPADEQARWDARQASRYGEGNNVDTPEAWLNRLYTYTNWITNEEGKVVTEPKERAKIIATRAEEIELSRQAYFDAKQARIDFDEALSRIPIGSPKEVTEPIYREYYDRLTEIYDRVPDYGEFFLSTKPVRLIEQDLRRDWWQLVKMSKPTWDGQPENYAKYEAAVAAWEAGLGSPEYSFFPAYIQSVMQRKVEMYQTKMKPDQLRNFNTNLVIDLVRETNKQGYQMYRLENDTVYDAAVEVYMRNYWNKYWDSIEGLKGDARSFADATFQWTNPPPNARTLYKWITELYGNRFSLNEVMTLSEEGQIFSYSIKERMNYNKTKEELMRDDSYNLLMWAGPGTHRDALNKAYQAEGGGSVDIDRFYWSDGHGFTSSEELKLFYERLTRAAVALGLKAPTGSQFQERMKVLELNEKFKEQINTELGYDFLRIENPEEGVTKGLNQWYNGLDFDMQKAFRDSAKIDEKDKADWARIQTYRKKREEYAKANPLWALYYYEYKKPKDLDIKPSFDGTAKPAIVGVEPGDTSLAFQAPRGVGVGSGMGGKDKREDREDLGGVPPSPVKRVSKLSIVQWPEGFRATVGDTVADEIEGLLKYGRYLSAPAKQYLYELAKRHRNWRGFIYNLLQR